MSELIRFECPKCGKSLSAKPQFVGRSNKCPKCQCLVKVPVPAPRDPHVQDDDAYILQAAPPKRTLKKPSVSQLDEMAFLVENLPLAEVFKRLKNAAGIDHAVTGSFSRSGIIRGGGASGISFIINVSEHDNGVAFTIDGETPDGPLNVGVLFDPTSAGGWGLAGAAAVFNSAMNDTANDKVASDVRTLLRNLLSAFDAESVLFGDDDDETSNDDSIEVMNNNLIVESVGNREVVTNLPRKDVYASILRALDSGQSTSAMQKLFGFVPKYKVEQVTYVNAESCVTGSIPQGGFSYGYHVRVDVTKEDNGMCRVSVNLKKQVFFNLDLGQGKRTAKKIRDSIVAVLKQKGASNRGRAHQGD